jgi:asparagine synthase (glutamine-hydrolysing)
LKDARGTPAGESLGAARIAELHAQKGAALFALLSGSYCVAILDARRDEALLVVDRVGTRPLGYRLQGRTLRFGSRFDAIEAIETAADLAGQPAQIDSQAIFDYVYHHMVPAPASIHAGFRRLQPAEFAAYRDGTLTTRRHWQLRYTENAAHAVADLKDEFIRVVRDSVQRASAGGSVGAFLSGGTDSSTIAGFLGEVTGAPARTYSIGFDAAGYDEMAYARIAAKHFGTRHHEYYVTPDDVVAVIR